MIACFETQRLQVYLIKEQDQSPSLAAQVPELLTKNVVAELPSYFSHVTNASQAEAWLTRMTTQSELIGVYETNNSSIIGFLFVSTSDSSTANIGYLFGEDCWGKGYASELLGGFNAFCKAQRRWLKLVAGVSANHSASIRVLLKSGFHEIDSNEEFVRYFEYNV